VGKHTGSLSSHGQDSTRYFPGRLKDRIRVTCIEIDQLDLLDTVVSSEGRVSGICHCEYTIRNSPCQIYRESSGVSATPSECYDMGTYSPWMRCSP
jgi:hypothetical protein